MPVRPQSTKAELDIPQKPSECVKVDSAVSVDSPAEKTVDSTKLTIKDESLDISGMFNTDTSLFPMDSILQSS